MQMQKQADADAGTRFTYRVHQPREALLSQQNRLLESKILVAKAQIFKAAALSPLLSPL
jgi:hypothetical protein